MDLHEEITTQAFRFHSAEKQFSEGRLSQTDYDQQRAKIFQALKTISKEYRAFGVRKEEDIVKKYQ